MKILAINSSYRGSHGQCQHLIDLLFAGAREAGADCECVVLSKLKINRCSGCNVCQKNARLINPAHPSEYAMECVNQDKDDVQMVFDKMAEADLMIYATPVYIFNISVLLKMLFDRIYGSSYAAGFRVTSSGLMFHHVNQKVIAKPFVPLIVCDNLEDDTPRTLLTYFETFSKFLEAPMVGKLVRNGGALSGYGNDPEAERKMPAIPKVYQAYHQAGLELAGIGKISRRTQNQANQEIIPVPFFSLLKKVKLRSVKEKFVEQANIMRANIKA